MDRWFCLGNKLVKNPTKEQLNNYEKHQIVEYRKGIEGIITEQWWVDVDKNEVIDFSYTILDYNMGITNEMRRQYFILKDVNPHFDKSYTLPTSWFDENSVKLPHC